MQAGRCGRGYGQYEQCYGYQFGDAGRVNDLGIDCCGSTVVVGGDADGDVAVGIHEPVDLQARSSVDGIVGVEQVERGRAVAAVAGLEGGRIGCRPRIDGNGEVVI